MKEHATKNINHPEHGEIKVDQKISELIESLLRLNIEVLNSCQEVLPGIMLIEFASSADAEDFLDYLFFSLNGNRKELLRLYERVYLNSDNSWNFSLLYTNLKEDDEDNRIPNKFRFSVSLRIPTEDYSIVLDEITNYLSLGIYEYPNNTDDFLDQL